jgi:hypothetical protein
MTGTLERTDTGTFAAVRPIENPVSAPYSRACGLLERWVADERHAVDEFAAWIEGQVAQAHAEMRLLCDELGLPVAWAEIPEQPVSVKPAEPKPGWTPRRRRSSDVLAQMYEEKAVQAYMDADTSSDMPGRDARTPRPEPAMRRDWSAEWAAFRDDVKDMARDLRQSLTWWR